MKDEKGESIERKEGKEMRKRRGEIKRKEKRQRGSRGGDGRNLLCRTVYRLVKTFPIPSF